MNLIFHVVADTSMHCPILLGRDFIHNFKLKITLESNSETVFENNDDEVTKIMHMESTSSD